MRARLACAAFLAVSAPTLAHAEPAASDQLAPRPQHRLRFDEDYRRAGIVDVAVTSVLLGTWLGLQLGVGLAEEPRWTDVPGIDRAARRAFVASSPGGRTSAALWSEVLWLGPMIWAGADSTVVPLATDRLNGDVAWQLTVMSGEAFTLTGIYARGGQIGFARERPDAAPCRRDEGYSGPCAGGRTASFPSGHSAGAMVGAGLVCAHHLELPLYGHPAADVGACVVATGFATTGSVLRLVADRHYLTDVLAGGAFGFAAGLGLPMLLHYHAPWLDDGAGAVRARLLPSAPRAEAGASIAGVF
jgi:membrane-associated phospholipid phosphatase